MSGQIFSGENGLFRITNKLFDIVVLSVLWLAMCLPIITIGPATTALYYTVVKCIRGSDPTPYACFLRSFRQNWRVGLHAWLWCLAAGALLGGLYVYLWLLSDSGNSIAYVLLVALSILLVPLAGALAYVFALLARFTFNVKTLLATSARLAMGHLPSTIVLGLLWIEVANVSLEYALPLLVSPVLTCLLCSLFLERIFEPYVEAQQPQTTNEPK